MKNHYDVHDNGLVTIYANGDGRYGWKITISKQSLEKVASITQGSWRVIKRGRMHYACTDVTKNHKTERLWMHRVITGIDAEAPLSIPVMFTKKYGFLEEKSDRTTVIENPKDYMVEHAIIRDGLFNVEENLLVRSTAPRVTKKEVLEDIFPSNLLRELIRQYQLFGTQEFPKSDFTDYFDANLFEIANIPDIKERQRQLQLCRTQINQLRKTPVGKRTEGILLYHQLLEDIMKKRVNPYDLYYAQNLSLAAIEEEFEEKESELKSVSIAPDHYILFYPYSEFHRSKKTFSSHFGQDLITPNAEYIRYRPFLFDLTDHVMMVLTRSIKVHPYYEGYLPHTLQELDELNDTMMRVSALRGEHCLAGELDFYANMVCEYGSDQLTFEPARIPKKYRKKI